MTGPGFDTTADGGRFGGSAGITTGEQRPAPWL